MQVNHNHYTTLTLASAVPPDFGTCSHKMWSPLDALKNPRLCENEVPAVPNEFAAPP